MKEYPSIFTRPRSQPRSRPHTHLGTGSTGKDNIRQERPHTHLGTSGKLQNTVSVVIVKVDLPCMGEDRGPGTRQGAIAIETKHLHYLNP